MKRTDFRYHFTKRIWYPDIDAQGVVYFPRYLEILDIAATEYFRTLGLALSEPRTAPMPEFHVVKCTIDYRAPLLLDEEIDVCVASRRIGRSSLTQAFAFFGKGQDDLRAFGEQVCVFVTKARGAPTPIAAEIVALLETYEGRHLRDAVGNTEGDLHG